LKKRGLFTTENIVVDSSEIISDALVDISKLLIKKASNIGCSIKPSFTPFHMLIVCLEKGGENGN
jgi:hypothetical protein